MHITLQLAISDKRDSANGIPFDELDMLDFKLSMEQIEKADVIFFREGKQVKIFKDRFNFFKKQIVGHVIP